MSVEQAAQRYNVDLEALLKALEQVEARNLQFQRHTHTQPRPPKKSE